MYIKISNIFVLFFEYFNSIFLLYEEFKVKTRINLFYKRNWKNSESFYSLAGLDMIIYNKMLERGGVKMNQLIKCYKITKYIIKYLEEK